MKVTLISSETPYRFAEFTAFTGGVVGVMAIVFQVTAALGIIFGIGLMLIELAPLGFAVFVDPGMHDIRNFEMTRHYDVAGNDLLRQIIFVDLLIGLITLPFWIIVVNRRIRESNRS